MTSTGNKREIYRGASGAVDDPNRLEGKFPLPVDVASYKSEAFAVEVNGFNKTTVALSVVFVELY